jgi:large subunit ribosomal protein L4
MTVLNEINLGKISTKAFAEVMQRFELEGALVVIDKPDSMVELSARNLKNVKVLRAEGVNVYDVLKYPNLVLTEAAVTVIEGALER